MVSARSLFVLFSALSLGVLAQKVDPTTAVCVLRPTSNNANSTIDGVILLESGVNGLPGIVFSWNITGLSDTNHTWHIHTFGDLSSATGAATGPHFRPCDNCRAPGTEQTYGNIGNGLSMILSVGGFANGTFNDPVLSLTGPNGILGRSIIIHGNAASPAPRVAQCVIGMVGANEPDVAQPPLAVTSRPVAARCDIEPTTNTGGPYSTTGPRGFFEFIENSKGLVEVRYNLRNLPVGNHTYHVHKAGDIRNASGDSVLGHFNGTCPATLCRANGTLQEIGNLDNGAPLVADATGVARRTYLDGIATLSGPNSIVGRSMIIHGDGVNPGARIAQCVIGIVADTVAKTNSVPSLATCRLYGSSTFYGTVRLSYTPDKTVRGVVRLSGLPAALTSYTLAVYSKGKIDEPGVTYATFKNVSATAFTPSASGELEVNFEEESMTLNGPLSILGRSLVLSGQTSANAQFTASCVIGTNEINDPITVGAQPPVTGMSQTMINNTAVPISVAGCTAVPQTAGAATGTIVFRRLATGGVNVTVSMTQLQPLANTSVHVHQTGNIDSPTFTEVLGHFLGTCSPANPCRPTGVLQEIGNLNDGKYTLADSNGAVTYSFVDNLVGLEGINSIIGRSVVIHGTATSSSPRVAHCVIGIWEENRVDCISGYYSPQETLICKPCGMGTYSNTTNANMCSNCPERSWSNTTASTTCTPCQENAVTTTYPAVSPTQCACNKGFKETDGKCIATESGSGSVSLAYSALLAIIAAAVALIC